MIRQNEQHLLDSFNKFLYAVHGEPDLPITTAQINSVGFGMDNGDEVRESSIPLVGVARSPLGMLLIISSPNIAMSILARLFLLIWCVLLCRRN